MNTAGSLTVLSSLNISAILNNISDRFFESSVSFIKFLALVFCYFFLKRSSEYDAFFLFRGYMIIFKTFAEFISAAVCVTYGIFEMDLSFLAGGTFGITMGFVVRIVLHYCQENSSNKSLSCATFLLTTFYILTVYACSAAFLHIVIVSGAIPCFTKVIINVLPMMALAKSVKHIISDRFFIANIVDFIALAIFWWHCTETCIKYFVIVPNIVAVILLLIESFSAEISKQFEDNGVEDGENSVKDGQSDDEEPEDGIISATYPTIEDLEGATDSPIIKLLNMSRPYRLLIE